MQISIRRSTRIRLLWRIVVLAVFALAAGSIPASAREMAQGEFQLSTATRLGRAILPAGQYVFTVETVGLIESFSSVRNSVAQPVVFVVRRKDDGTAFNRVFAFASSQAFHPGIPAGLNLFQETTGVEVRSLVLENLGIVIDFTSGKKEFPVQASLVRTRLASGKD